MFGKKVITRTIKATIINIIMAILITVAFIYIIQLFFGKEINEGVSLINMMSV